ncbi:MAG: restriction endonuclease subunit R [Syntrophus sp. (in: bacteria)]|nr:restriction endonuclease subunit R [Syntrophus sp. (in: bacteria)]
MITLTLDHFCAFRGIPSQVARIITDRLTMDNPKYLENEKRGRWNGNTDDTLTFYKKVTEGLICPRGFTKQAISILKRYDLPYRVIDNRRTLPDHSFTFTGTLTPAQEEAKAAILKRDHGTLTAPTGSGKTVLALSIIATRKQPTLVIVHTKELLTQWIDRAASFLNIPVKEIGMIGNGKQHIGKITIGTVQSLKKHDIYKHFGQVIVDECHHTPSTTFLEVITGFDAKYILGLSATPYRRDGLTRLIYFYLGDVVHRIEKSDLIQSGDLVPLEVIKRETAFTTWLDPTEEYSGMITELTEDTERNRLIVRDVEKEYRQGETCLILSDRKEHCRALAGLLQERGIETAVLIGDVSTVNRQVIVDRLNSGTLRAVCGTTQLIGEGFDCKALSVAFIATPIKFSGKLIQVIGRVLRPGPGKKQAKVYDYVDSNIGVLRSSAISRGRVYKIQEGLK